MVAICTGIAPVGMDAGRGSIVPVGMGGPWGSVVLRAHGLGGVLSVGMVPQVGQGAVGSVAARSGRRW